MQYWEMILNPLGIILTLYVIWIIPGAVRAYKGIRKDGTRASSEQRGVRSCVANIRRRTPAWFGWGFLVWSIAGVVVLLWEEKVL